VANIYSLTSKNLDAHCTADNGIILFCLQVFVRISPTLCLYVGWTGFPGGPGATGSTGFTGVPGEVGASGFSGPQGPFGFTGAPGSPGFQGIHIFTCTSSVYS